MAGIDFRARPGMGLREWWVALCGSILLAALVLHEPIARLGTHTLGPWDNLVQQSAQLRGEQYERPLNPALTDPARQFVPWALQARGDWEAGRAPLWNPWNCAGVPLLANFQSALLSPFTLPFYVLPLDLASLASALAKLAASVFLTYGFLRACGVGRPAAAFGAVAYSWSTGHLMLLLHPHPAVTAMLPGLLWCIERLFQSVERGERGASWRWATLLALATAITCLAGHPEMLLVDALVCAVYAIVRAFATRSWRLAASAALPLASGAVLGALLAAPQLLPFGEYMLESDMYRRPTRFLAQDVAEQLPLLVFPDFIGNPLDAGIGITFTPKPNYQEAQMYYAGALPLWLALVALALGIWRTRWAVLTGWALLVVLVVWNVASLGESIGRYLTAGLIPWGRLYPVLGLGAAVSAAWALQRGAEERRPMRWLALVATSAALVFGAAYLGVERFLDLHANEGRVDAATWRAVSDAHVGWIALCFGLGVVAVAAYGCVRTQAARAACAAVLVLAHFGSTVTLFGKYVPTVPNEDVLPQTQAMGELQERVHDGRTLYVGRDRLAVNANALYEVEQVLGYDALSVADFETATRILLRSENYHAEVNYVTRFALQVLGVRHVVSRNEWLPIDTRQGMPSATNSRRSAYYDTLEQREELPPERRVSIGVDGLRQSFRAVRPELSGVVLHFSAIPAAMTSPLLVRLTDEATGERLAERRFEPRHLSWFNHSRREFALYFPPVRDSARRNFELEVLALDPRAPQVEVVLAAPREDAARPVEASARRGRRMRTAQASVREATLTSDVAQPQDAAVRNSGPRLVQDVAYGSDIARHGWRARARLYEYTASRGEAWMVAGVLPARDRTEAAWHLGEHAYNPYLTVLLEGERSAQAPRRDLVSEVELVEDGPQRTRWKTRANLASFLVLARVHYPGWVARVDGEPVELERANLAFCAVELPAGEHEVELSYEPDSWRYGLGLCAFGMLGLCGTVVLSRARRPRPGPREGA